MTQQTTTVLPSVDPERIRGRLPRYFRGDKPYGRIIPSRDGYHARPYPPTREELRDLRAHLARPKAVPPEALRLVAERMAGDAGYALEDLIGAQRGRGRPSPERAALRDALARIVFDLRTLPSGSDDVVGVTLENIGTALGLDRKAVLRLQRARKPVHRLRTAE